MTRATLVAQMMESRSIRGYRVLVGGTVVLDAEIGDERVDNITRIEDIRKLFL
jgi:hypothetical protein